MIFGIGIDLVEVARVEDSFRKFPDRFERKMFTEIEREYCNRMPAPALHFAARFAAKEAFLKAIGTGKSHGIGWRDVGVRNLKSGQPVLELEGRARQLAAEYGVSISHISLTHTRTHAAAVVVIERKEGLPTSIA
jgi:holo-[acyl-carrier protein] synthase